MNKIIGFKPRPSARMALLEEAMGDEKKGNLAALLVITVGKDGKVMAGWQFDDETYFLLLGAIEDTKLDFWHHVDEDH